MARQRNRPEPPDGRRGFVVCPTIEQGVASDESGSLLEYLKGNGQLRQASQAQLWKARNLYVSKGHTVGAIAQKLGLPVLLVESWVTAFDWENIRNKKLYAHFVSTRKLFQKRGAELDERHDRIGLTVESIIERMLHKHLDPDDSFELDPKDLKAVSAAIKDMQLVRRTSHNKDTGRATVDHNINFDTTESFNSVAEMITGLFGGPPQLTAKPQLEILSDAMDAEFEVVDESQSS